MASTVAANAKFLDHANQLLHNAGVVFEKRIDVLLDLLQGRPVLPALQQALAAVTLSKEELYQQVFMLYGSKYLKKEFDQFYTPITVGEFLCSLCDPHKKAIDPACGTGDLLIAYTGDVTLWDISSEVVDLARQNYAFQTKPATLQTQDSLRNATASNGTFDYAVVNPPFGTKTVVTDPEVLNQYALGRGKKKQEVGILFVERSLNLLKPSGRLAILLPNGYFGNTTNAYVELRTYLRKHRILAVVKLPANTFKRSGTGVSTTLLMVENTPTSEDYDIFIEDVADIGYELNKKNTPFKYRRQGADYVLDSHGRPVLQNDLPEVAERLKTFLRLRTAHPSYQVVNTSALDAACMLDISRYLKSYTGIVANSTGKVAIRDLLVPDATFTFAKEPSREYTYIDIKEINTPLHHGKKLLGHALPSRAKYSVRKGDVLVSRLKGTVAFTVLQDDRVCTNGVCVLRPRDDECRLLLFAGLFSTDFKIQHASLTTGSIMESISDEDMKNIVIPRQVDRNRFERILTSLAVLQAELPTS
jgi:type I restriction enzyme M protein